MKFIAEHSQELEKLFGHSILFTFVSIKQHSWHLMNGNMKSNIIGIDTDGGEYPIFQ